jgi:hypothetical protein
MKEILKHFFGILALVFTPLTLSALAAVLLSQKPIRIGSRVQIPLKTSVLGTFLVQRASFSEATHDQAWGIVGDSTFCALDSPEPAEKGALAADLAEEREPLLFSVNSPDEIQRYEFFLNRFITSPPDIPTGVASFFSWI